LSGDKKESPLSDLKAARRVAVLCHMHADPDTYLSAYALRFLIGKLSPEATVDIIVPDGMSVLTQRLAQSFPRQTPQDSSDYDLIVAVDIGHTELLKDWNDRLRSSNARKILIDHHPLQENAPYDRLIVDTGASSAAQVVYSLFRELGVEPDPDAAQALLTGILFDSQNLSIAGIESLRAVIDLLGRGADLEKARASLRSPPDYGEAIAKLKAARRSKIYRASGWIIAVSTVGSFQASVARAFISLGADIALVVGEFDDETRGSLRASHRFHSETKVHLGTDIAPVISKDSGYGGGHPTAASFTCKGTDQEVIEAFLALIGGLLKEKPVEIT
jgi:nanoRNase/pAp phosphatase (c-di-AMP/oligoRNAs hydrolase)